MSRVALAVSPHLDDAVFSAGGTLATLAADGWTVLVATLFTRSVPDPQGFALACQLDKGLGPDVDYMALRRAEDATALAGLGAVPVHLGFAEAPHRGYASAPALFGPPLAADDGIVPALAEALHDLLHTRPPDLILAPQGIGGHVDHVQAVHALRAAAVPTMPVWWWRDFPYVARGASPAEPFRAALAGLRDEVVGIGAAARAAKATACRAYASQLGFQFGGEAGLDQALAAAGPVEHFRSRSPADMLLG